MLIDASGLRLSDALVDVYVLTLLDALDDLGWQLLQFRQQRIVTVAK
jgi:hypothetical protein